jgi:hypothetical protein
MFLAFNLWHQLLVLNRCPAIPNGRLDGKTGELADTRVRVSFPAIHSHQQELCACPVALPVIIR